MDFILNNWWIIALVTFYLQFIISDKIYWLLYAKREWLMHFIRPLLVAVLWAAFIFLTHIVGVEFTQNVRYVIIIGESIFALFGVGFGIDLLVSISMFIPRYRYAKETKSGARDRRYKDNEVFKIGGLKDGFTETVSALLRICSWGLCVLIVNYIVSR